MTEQKPSRKRVEQRVSCSATSRGKVQESMKLTNMDLPTRKKQMGVGGGGPNNSHRSQHSPHAAVSNPSMPHLRLDWKAPWQPLGSGGRRERLLLSANEVGTWGSVSLRFSFCTTHHTIDGRGTLSINACWVTPSSLISIRDGLCGCRVSGVIHIGFCPVGKITNGSEIAVPQTGSSLSSSHANPQSAPKPGGWC